MKILNLGCGTKTSSSDAVVNIDWSPYLRLRRNRIGRLVATRLLRGERRQRFLRLGDNVLVHDVSKGIPFADASIDAVYHSHFLEHIDRARVGEFLAEVRRVLRPGGIHRIVVPDLEHACRAYLAHLETCRDDASARPEHDGYVAVLLEQSVRREAYGTSTQPQPLRYVENLVLGDARRRGETHQWMYDRINLPALLEEHQFREPQIRDHRSSAIDRWDEIGLDRDAAGGEYKPGSLYVECLR